MPSIKMLLPQIADRIDQQFQSENPGRVDGVMTGIPAFDESLMGFQRGDISLLVGEPGVGKTTLAVQMASLISGFQSDGAVVYISWRESSLHLGLRVIAYSSGLSLRNFVRGDLRDEDWNSFTESLTRFNESNLELECISPELGVLKSVLLDAVSGFGKQTCLVIIDDCWGYTDDPEEALAFLKWLKSFALKYKTAVLLTGTAKQLTGNDKVWGYLSAMSDLTLDLIPEMGTDVSDSNLFVRKQRMGQPFVISLKFNEVHLYH